MSETLMNNGCGSISVYWFPITGSPLLNCDVTVLHNLIVSPLALRSWIFVDLQRCYTDLISHPNYAEVMAESHSEGELVFVHSQYFIDYIRHFKTKQTTKRR